jgi:DNA adenine methylase
MRTPSTQPTSPAPFLRWAGGKRQLLDSITSCLPDIDASTRFFEVFVGGGAVMFKLGEKDFPSFIPGKRLIINDVNPDLVATYRTVRDDLASLFDELEEMSKDTTKVKFEAVRRMQPKTDVEKAARFIYLNKTCFNGLWRVNGKGDFNVPWGKLKNPTIYSPELLSACSERLQGAQIRCAPFATALSDAKKGDLVYLDPPYIPLSASASFSKYAQHDFSVIDHYSLAGVIQGLTERGVRIMLSNSDTELTRHIYRKLGLWQVSASRSISAASSSRGRVKELIGVNYHIHTPPKTINLVSFGEGRIT